MTNRSSMHKKQKQSASRARTKSHGKRSTKASDKIRAARKTWKRMESKEPSRRLKLLGNCTNRTPGGVDRHAVRERARAVFVSFRILLFWLMQWLEHGMQGLVAQWSDVSDDEILLALRRWRLLGKLADAESVTMKDIEAFAARGARKGWTVRKVVRWLKRYRHGGLYALLPRNYPERRKRLKNRALRELVVLTEDELDIVYERLAILGDLRWLPHITNKQIDDRILDVEAAWRVKGEKDRTISRRTFRQYHTDLKRYGYKGLAPKERSDKGVCRGITPRMEELVRGYRLREPNVSVTIVYEECVKLAKRLGERPPTLSQVTNICARIAKAQKLLAAEDESGFQQLAAITYRFSRDGGGLLVYHIDHQSTVPVMVKDLRKAAYRSKDGKVRPHLTLVLEPKSGLILAAKFSYDKPDQYMVAAALCDAFLALHAGGRGGLPRETWADRGLELHAKHVRLLTKILGVDHHACKPRAPRSRPRQERVFRTLGQRLWSKQPGYCGSNIKKRPAKIKAELTLAELEKRFWKYVDEEYNCTPHGRDKVVPIEYWDKHWKTVTADPNEVALLLMKRERRTLEREGIYYENRLYWHDDFYQLAAPERVTICAEDHYGAPDHIMVFRDTNAAGDDGVGGAYVCTAFAVDSYEGRKVTQERIGKAKTRQRARIKAANQDAITALAAAEKQVPTDSKKGSGAEEAPVVPVTEPTPHDDLVTPDDQADQAATDSAPSPRKSKFLRLAAGERS